MNFNNNSSNNITNMMRADQSLPSSSPSSFIRSLPSNANDASPRREDVVFGGGGNIHPNHPGNVVYERLINSFRQRYLISRDALVKETIVESIVRAIQGKGGRFLEFIISDQSMTNSSGGIINGRRGGKWYAIGDSQAVLRTARELSNRNNNPNLFAATTVAAFDQNRRMAVAQEQQQREDQLLSLQRQQQQQQNHGHFATAGNNAVASMGYGVVENDRDRAKAAVVAAFGPELDEERTVLRTTESSIEMERMMILRDEQQQKQQQQQQSQLQQHQQLQQQLQLQHQQQQLLQRQQQEQVLARAMEERQRQHILEQQVHVQSQLQAQANALQQQSMPELYTVRERDVVIASASSNFWAQNPGNISFKEVLSANQKLFQTWPGSTRLKHISLSIVATFRDRKGRFLKKHQNLPGNAPLRIGSSDENSCNDDGRGHEAIWYDISDSKAIEWTSELLNRMYEKNEMIKSQPPVAAASITDKIVPKLADVLWSRGLSQHPGNLTYRKMVLASMQDQSVLNWNETKLNAVSKSIVTTIKVEYNGRFLQNINLQQQDDDDDSAPQSESSMIWCEISTDKAFEKTLCALREAREELLRHVAVKEQEQNNVARLPDAVENPGETDVVFGAGPGTEALKHPGNQVYRSLVHCNTGRYRSCESEEKKRRICRSVVAAIKGQDGRFLKLNRATGLWQVIPDSKTIELTSAILERVDKNTTTKNIVGNPRLQHKQQGTKSKPIDIIDVDEDNTEITPPAIKPPTVKNPIKRDTTHMSNNRKKFCTNTMVQELYKLQEEKAPGINVTANEYIAIEKVTKKKFGLGDNVYVSKKLVQNMASEMRRAARRVEVIHREETVKEEEVVEVEESEEVEEDNDDAESDSDDSLVF